MNKKKDTSYTENFSIKITKAQKGILDKNKWIRDDIRMLVRATINEYLENS